MPRGQQRNQYLNFVGGLNTESSPLLFPENTAKDLSNVDLFRDGSIRRRKAIDFESLGAYSDISFSESDLETYAITEHEWQSVGGDDSVNFAVLQIGGDLYFHNLGTETLSLGAIGKLSLDSIKARTDYKEFPISATTGGGKFFIVSRGISPAYIEYDADTGEFRGVKLTLKVRDLDGINEEDDSPLVFDTSLDTVPVSPEEDVNDVISPPTDPNDFSEFTEITFTIYF